MMTLTIYVKVIEIVEVVIVMQFYLLFFSTHIALIISLKYR